MAETRQRQRYVVNDYQTYDKTAIPLDGETWYFRNVVAGNTAANWVIGDGVTQLGELAFEKPIVISGVSSVNLTSADYPKGDYRIVNSGGSDIEIQWDSETKNNCLVLPNNTGLFTKTTASIYCTNMKGPSKKPIMLESDTIPSYAALLDGSATTSGTIGADLYGSNYTDWRGLSPIGKGEQTLTVGTDSVTYGDLGIGIGGFIKDRFQRVFYRLSITQDITSRAFPNTVAGGSNLAWGRGNNAGDPLATELMATEPYTNGSDGEPRGDSYTSGPGRIVNYIAQVRYAVY